MKNGTIYKYNFFLENDSIPISQMHNKSPSLTVWRHINRHEEENLYENI